MGPTQEHDRVGTKPWFDELWEKHHDAVLRYAAGRSDLEIGRDVVIETFEVVWRKPKKVPSEPDEVLPWLFSVAKRQLANNRRTHRRAMKLVAHLATFGGAPRSETPEDPEAEETPVVRALGRLSQRDQEILRLTYWEDLDRAQAAIVLGCSPSAASTRLHRAKKRLAQALKEIGHSGAAVNTTGASTTVVEEKR